MSLEKFEWDFLNLAAVVVKDGDGLVVRPGVKDALLVLLLELVDHSQQPVDQN